MKPSRIAPVAQAFQPAGSRDFPVPCSGFSKLGTGKSPEPADRNVCATPQAATCHPVAQVSKPATQQTWTTAPQPRGLTFSSVHSWRLARRSGLQTKRAKARTTNSIHPRWLAGLSWAALLVPGFALCGCLSKPPLKEQTFAFSTPALPATNAAPGDRVLGVRTLQIASPFDGRPLIYRTGEFSFERDPYAVFLGPPAEGLVAPVCGLLRAAGCFSAVVGPRNLSTAKSDALVNITINQFYGDFRKSEGPAAVLALQVTFFDATNGLPGSVILQRDYSRRIPVNSATAAALMAGWNQALVGIVEEVASDLCSRTGR